MNPNRPMMLASALLAAALAAAPAARASDVVINGQPLQPEIRQQLEAAYQTRIKPGRYWYDGISGGWGVEGGPMAGQIAPGLPLGGPLRADASGRNRTGVFINGRQLHPQDVAALSRCTQVQPGRFWVLANGIGGWEGGPAAFNLAQLCGGRGSSRQGNTQCDDYGNGQFNCSNSRTGIGIIGEGGGAGGVFVDGKVIMTPN